MTTDKRGFSLSMINAGTPTQQKVMRTAMLNYRAKNGHFKGLYQYSNLYCTECKQESNKINSIRIVDPDRLEYAKLLCIDCATVNLKSAEKSCSLSKSCEHERKKAREKCNFAKMVVPNLKDIEDDARRRGDKSRQKMASVDIMKAKKECLDANKDTKRSCGGAAKRECNISKMKVTTAMDNVDKLKLKQQILLMPKVPTHLPKQNSPLQNFAPPAHRAKKAAHRPPLEIPAQELLGRSIFNGDLAGVERSWEAGANVNTPVFWIGAPRGPARVAHQGVPPRVPLVRQVAVMVDVPRTCGVGDDGTLTAAFVAARQGHADVLRFLLAKGANPNMGDTSDGMSPCLVACTWRHAECVRVLVEAGANPNLALTDGSNFTPLYGDRKCRHSRVPTGFGTRRSVDFGQRSSYRRVP